MIASEDVSIVMDTPRSGGSFAVSYFCMYQLKVLDQYYSLTARGPPVGKLKPLYSAQI